MLYYVSGPVTVLEPGLAVIDCGGVGYGCRITAYTAGQLKLNQSAKLYITESIREDAFDLYGFSSREEQRCYELLTSVNGVGPKAAMAILSSGGPQNFTLAVQMEPGNMEYRQALAMLQQRSGGYRPYGTGTTVDGLDCCTTMLCLNCLCGGGSC